MAKKLVPDIERFRRHYVEDASGCWLWTASRSGKGYGQFTDGSRTDNTNRTTPAHRWFYEYLHGPLAPGIFVCHSCDVRACVNPTHLWPGTQKDNLQDMERKDRHPHNQWDHTPKLLGDRNPSRTHPERLRRGNTHPARLKPECLARGEQHGNARFTADVVRWIRNELPIWNRPRAMAITAQLGCSMSAIQHIFYRRTWGHLP